MSIENRFWSKVDRSGGDDSCWNWLAGKHRKGHGKFCVNHRDSVLAHRMAWQLTYGDYPSGSIIIQTCENKLCVNPRHLILSKCHELSLQRFWGAVEKTDKCWLWTGAKDKDGYGCFTPFDGKLRKAHRYSWEIEYGQIPKGSMVRHFVCDNPSCVRPDHLRVGNNQDNMNDMTSKNRQAKGEVAARSKLTESQVKEILKKLQQGMSLTSLSRQYAVTIPAVSAIRDKKTWKHIQ